MLVLVAGGLVLDAVPMIEAVEAGFMEPDTELGPDGRTASSQSPLRELLQGLRVQKPALQARLDLAPVRGLAIEGSAEEDGVAVVDKALQDLLDTRDADASGL